AINGKALRPSRAKLPAARTEIRVEMGPHTVRNKKMRVFRSAVSAFGQAYLVLAQRFTVRGGTIMLVRGAVTDVTVDHDQRRRARFAPVGFEHADEAVRIICIGNMLDIPTISRKARGDILAEGERGLSLNRDVIVVIDPGEVPERQMASERGRLARDAL